jgi:glutamyl/glutaminyl-tRNA synthetase
LAGTGTGAGSAVYACGCSREKVRRDAEAAGRPGLYPGTCGNAGLTLDSGALWRLRVPSNSEVTVRDLLAGDIRLHPGMELGDFVLRLRNGDPCYQLASILDDEIFGIDLVVRGLDLLPSTGAQLFLAGVLGMETFPKARFLHHGLLVEPEGEKLSKSAGSVSLSSMRGRLRGPGPILRWFAKNLGMDAPDSVRPRDLLEGFSPAKIPTTPLPWAELIRETGLA